MKILCDLHLHSTASDGELTPSLLVELLVRRRIKVAALTDHDTFAGWLEFQQAALAQNLQPVIGAEWSCIWNDKPLHLLGYAFDPDSPEMIALAESQRIIRRSRAEVFLNKLKHSRGIELPQSLLIHSSVCRSHVARALIDGGHAKDMEDVFQNYSELADSGSEYPWPSMHRVMEIIKQAGGLSVLAHPGDQFTRRDLRDMKKAGLDGIEIWHPSHGKYATKDLAALAFQMRFVKTGGSDFHDRDGMVGEIGVSEAVWKRESKRFEKG